MASNDKPLRYSPLPGPSFIRIVTLLPSLTHTTPLRITLNPANIDSSPRPEYEALSYTWDDQLRTHTIACDAFVLKATANVSQALQRLRYTDRRRRLWIDAICINQNDEDEKTTQVSMMDAVFACASRVNVWLSGPTEAMREVFEYMRLTTGPELKMPPVSDGKSQCLYPKMHICVTYLFQGSLRSLASFSPDRIPFLKRGLQELASHQYWTRAWTVQEVALNKNCWVYIGSLEPMGLLDFRVMLYEVEGHTNVRSEALAEPVADDLYPVAFRRTGLLSRAMELHDHKDYLDENLLDDTVLRSILGKRAKYPLDVIFALRALMPQTLGQIPVDYKLDLAEVMREATVLLLPKLKRLGDLLETVSLCPAVEGAPSWTLNFAFGGHLGSSCHFWGMWYASTMNSSNVTVTSPDGHVLHTKGRIVDYATAVSDTFPHYTTSRQAKWHEETRNILSRWRQNCLEHDLRKGFEDSVSDILLAATDQHLQFASDMSQHTRFEQVRNHFSKTYDI